MTDRSGEWRSVGPNCLSSRNPWSIGFFFGTAFSVFLPSIGDSSQGLAVSRIAEDVDATQAKSFETVKVTNGVFYSRHTVKNNLNGYTHTNAVVVWT